MYDHRALDPIHGKMIKGKYYKPDLPPGSMIEVLLEAINTRGDSLMQDGRQREMVLANRKNIALLLLGMRGEFKKYRMDMEKWRCAQKNAAVFLKMARGESYDQSMADAFNGLQIRRDHWLRLYDAKKDKDVLALPSIDLEQICRDPVNLPRILGRFTGTVGYAMMLAVKNVADLQRYVGSRDTSNPKMKPMEQEEYLSQLRCLWYGLERVVVEAQIEGDYPVGSIIDLVMRTLKEATLHMGRSEKEANALERATERIGKTRRVNGFTYFDRLLEAAKKDGMGDGMEDDMKGGMIEWGKLWPHDNYKTILLVVKRIGGIVEGLYAN
jgi:hypothetical protein